MTEKAQKPKTGKDQYNDAIALFRSIADTLSELSETNFNEKLKLFREIHRLIKVVRPISLRESTSQSNDKDDSRILENVESSEFTDKYVDACVEE